MTTTTGQHRTRSPTLTEYVASICRKVAVSLTCLLALLVPFDPVRNIDLQGLILLVIGGFAWTSVLLKTSWSLKQSNRIAVGLLSTFIIACLVSLLINPHFSYDFYGAPYLRLGTAGLIACLGSGLLFRTLPLKRLLTGLYGLITIIAVVSIPYSLIRFHALGRIAGLFAQTTTLAAFLGCGFLIGLELFRVHRPWRRYIIASQLVLIAELLVTETRAVLALVVVLSLVWILYNRHQLLNLRRIIYLSMVGLILGSLYLLLPGRLTNESYAVDSVQYRLLLQKRAITASWQSPYWGYGLGNLADALTCERLPDKSLQATCQQGYFFNSSHNIFLDRILAIGWIGGLSYTLFAGYAIYRGLRSHSNWQRLAACLALLIAGYYFTNVTNVELELVFWILLLSVCTPTPHGNANAT